MDRKTETTLLIMHWDYFNDPLLHSLLTRAKSKQHQSFMTHYNECSSLALLMVLAPTQRKNQEVRRMEAIDAGSGAVFQV